MITFLGVQWSFDPVKIQGRRPRQNIYTTPMGLTNFSSSAVTPLEFFDLFLTEDILVIIVKYTNEKAEEVYHKLPVEKKNKWKWFPLTILELRAFIGLLLSGVHSESKASVKYLWAQMRSSERPFYSATMSRNRFESIARFLRFDHKPIREERRLEDKLVIFREVNDLFVRNIKRNFNPSDHVCCDECLLAFDGICPFKVFIKSKPDKTGIKVWTLADCKTNYIINFQVYTGNLSKFTIYFMIIIF